MSKGKSIWFFSSVGLVRVQRATQLFRVEKKDGPGGPPNGGGLCWVISIRRDGFAEWEESNYALEIRT
jgi:hypothetical protein